MARYDYHCTDCDYTFEVDHPMSEKPEILCPHCSKQAHRKISSSAITFTGSGFYNTDNRTTKRS